MHKRLFSLSWYWHICSWTLKRQNIVAQSSAEAEYVAAAKATSQGVWLRRMLKDIGEKQEGTTMLFCNYNHQLLLRRIQLLMIKQSTFP